MLKVQLTFHYLEFITMFFFILKLSHIALQYHVLLRHYNAVKAKVKTFKYFKDMGFNQRERNEL